MLKSIFNKMLLSKVDSVDVMKGGHGDSFAEAVSLF